MTLLCHPLCFDGGGNLRDLKTFELVLETFAAKKHQLDTVVECARTWRFPLQGTRYELVHDGSVEAMKWTQAAYEDASPADGSGLREQECSSSSSEQSESRDVREEMVHNSAEVAQDDHDLGGDDQDNWDGARDEPWDDDETFGPTSHWDEEDQSDLSAASPIYDRDGAQDKWDASPNEPWMHDSQWIRS